MIVKLDANSSKKMAVISRKFMVISWTTTRLGSLTFIGADLIILFNVLFHILYFCLLREK